MVFLRILLAFILAVFAGAAVTTLANTEVNLQALAGVGAEIGMGARLDAMGRDLAGFGPTMAIVLGIGFLIAFLVAGLVVRLAPGLRLIAYPAAGAAAVIAVMVGITLFYGAMLDATITPVAAARTLPGLLALSTGGLVAGWVMLTVLPGRERA